MSNLYFDLFVEKLKQYNMQHNRLLSALSLDYLEFLEIRRPSKRQIRVIEHLVYRKHTYEDFTFYYPLTLQELKCLYLASEGYDIKDTANFLKITIRAVENHRTSIIKKLNCKNIAHSIKKGMEKGII
ncbi:MAG: helix-turn-helix transcriptional regulator [Candidatus Rickettsiella isopodorum]